MTLQEVFNELNLEGAYEEQCKQYAEMLDSGYVLGFFPEELIGNDTSQDGVWNWPKKTGFINKYKNNVDFNDIICIFDKPHPDGVFIINSHFDYSSGYDRERILARISKGNFVDVRVNYEFHEIYLAKKVSRKRVDIEINQLIISSSVNYLKYFLDLYEAEDGKTIITKTRSNIFQWIKFYHNYINNSISKDDASIILNLGMNIPIEETDWLINLWEKDREREERHKKMEAEENKL